MGDIILLGIVMAIIALVSFAPLGFFIYRFTNKGADPLGVKGSRHEPNPKLEDLVDRVCANLITKLPPMTKKAARPVIVPKTPASPAAAPAPAAAATKAPETAQQPAAPAPSAAKATPAAAEDKKPASKASASKTTEKKTTTRRSTTKPKA